MNRALSIGVVVALYAAHRVGRRSGASDAEVRAALPGDAVVRDPRWQSTRAITINEPPDQVWPWVVQMGFPTHRAGWYTPPWLDRLTFGIRATSSDQIRPDLQQLDPGDRVPDSDDWSVYFTVAAVDRPHALVLHSTRHLIKPIRTVDFSWAFVLREIETRRTRLYIRARVIYAPVGPPRSSSSSSAQANYVNAGAMLRGIKARAERAERPQSASSGWGSA